MVKLALLINAASESTLRAKIAQASARKLRGYLISLHTKILDATAYNTGRTLASWAGSMDKPLLIDAADVFGANRFEYDPEVEATNHLPVGRERGEDRGDLERYSLKTTKSLRFETNPYRIFYISNGARLDSGLGIFGLDSLPSSLAQGPGSRAAMQEAGAIAAYDVYGSVFGEKSYAFIPRTEGSFQITVENFRLYPTIA